MSDSDWSRRDKIIGWLYSAFCAFVLVSAFYWYGALAGYHEGRSVEASTEHRANARQKIEQRCSDTPSSSVLECVYDAVEASQQNEISEQDLAAQQGMEGWAFWMVVAAVFQTLVAGAALVFLMKDLRQNRTTAEAQLRAYIGIEKITLQAFDFTKDKKVKFRVKFTLRNYGQSVANDTFVETSCYVQTPGHAETCDEEKTVIKSRSHEKEMVEVPHPFGLFSPSQSRDGRIDVGAIPDDVSLRVIFKISYFDVFDRKWYQEGRYFGAVPTGDNITETMSVVPNTAFERACESDPALEYPANNDSRHHKED